MLDKQKTDKSDLLSELRSCLVCDESHDLDVWIVGVIHSLYYKPNHKILVLNGAEGIGKTFFIENLLPKEINYPFKDIYSSLICDLSFSCGKFFNSDVNQAIINAMSDNFKVVGYSADKRLASYAITTNSWGFPQRRTIRLLNIKYIDKERFNSIDKLQLWSQLFKKYKL